MTIRAVIDTNIWVSAILNPSGYPAKLRKAFENGLFKVVVSEAIIEEIADVLRRPRIKDKYASDEDDILQLLILIEERSEHVLISGEFSICRDKDDDLIIETAVKGNVEFLVTRDDDVKNDENVLSFLSRSGITTISIANFLKHISSQS